MACEALSIEYYFKKTAYGNFFYKSKKAYIRNFHYIPVDDDGNMLNDGTWSLSWDAENRMKSSVNGTRTLEYKYDFMSRRIEKKVIDSGTTSKYLRFVYDGYKFIEELDALNNNAIRKKIIWNGEAPFSLTDIVLSATYYYVLDANKNVSDLIDADGNIVAHYEYSPFGKITYQSGTYADENPLRFSSEYFDSETGFVYYNYRYYSPVLGRWINRDPIGEDGGLNLYDFIGNDGVNKGDYLGMFDFNSIGPESPSYVPFNPYTPQGQSETNVAEGKKSKKSNAGKCCGDKTLKAEESCCSGKYPYNPETTCCKGKVMYEKDYFTCLGKCIEAKRAVGNDTTGNTVHSYEAANTVADAITNTVAPKPFGNESTGRSTGAWSRLGQRLSVKMPFRILGTNNMLRALGRLSGLGLVGEGFYDLGVIARCELKCNNDACAY